MKTRHTLSAFLFVLCLTAATSSASPAETWGTSYKVALAQAAKENKPVLMEFTGSTWCPACIALRKRVLSKPAFVKYAAENLILLKVDFPPFGGDWSSPAIEKQNMALLEKYQTGGLVPTLIILNSKGKEITRTMDGLPTTPDELIKWIQAAQK